jgi:hypothetical protein
MSLPGTSSNDANLVHMQVQILLQHYTYIYAAIQDACLLLTLHETDSSNEAIIQFMF